MYSIGEKVTIVDGDMVVAVVTIDDVTMRGDVAVYRSGGHEFTDKAARPWRAEDDVVATRVEHLSTIEWFSHHHMWSMLSAEDMAAVDAILTKYRPTETD